MRLTLVYGALLLLSGGGLVALVYFLVRESLYDRITRAVTGWVPALRLGEVPEGAVTSSPGPAATVAPPFSGCGSGSDCAVTRNGLSGAVEQATLNRLLTVSLVALALFALVSLVLAWWLAGRVLRPVGVIAETARRLSGENLHQRIALAGPPGELKRLADTFDEMLDRIEQLVSAQQRFAANAAHELRTPLAVQRAAAEIGLADPDPAQVARIRGKLLEVAGDSERLIEGLLLLSAADQGVERAEPVDLGRTVEEAVAGLAGEAERHEVTVAVDAAPLPVTGDPVLLHHLVENLVANAVRHNVPGGTVTVTAGPAGLVVRNTGPAVPPDVVPQLFEPFRRLKEREHKPGSGAGLGLSIVASITRAHGWTVAAEANAGGGLTVRVRP
ncbi:HAMP domain-containing sensor histidine kinase [Streptomyces sp. B-S-A12]|uniref:histidine kinase n=2 Tax=Streptomyces luteolus TaxID=3043615 RepID=A0ABT6T2H8_9ACTN|nr:HAMP domain-containing sensor histidine kinase [Streptomyces sp. B-S-A12]MDI3421553.1 HAMP domain-containing sensor histidine kinase [Streptomyces sp. B-S-A12]